MSANGVHQRTSLPIDGNKRKIESLRIENLMKETEKVSIIDRFNNNYSITNYQPTMLKMKTLMARRVFIRRKFGLNCIALKQ